MGIWINNTGLFLDIVGAVLIWRYGLPEAVSRSGEVSLLLDGTPDKAEISKARHFDSLSRLGLALLILGFVVQMVSNHV